MNRALRSCLLLTSLTLCACLGSGGGSATINLANGCVLSGTYAFRIAGFGSNGPTAIAGQFTVRPTGEVTGGVQDVKTSAGVALAQTITGGTCLNGTFGQPNSLSLTTAAGTSAYNFLLANSAPAGRMVDAAGSASGSFALQTVGTFPSDVVFGLIGTDSGGNRLGSVGRFTVEPGGVVSGGQADVNDNGTVSSAVAVTGDIGMADSSGRGTATLAIHGQTYDLAYYLVSSTQAFAIDIDSASPNPSVQVQFASQSNPGTYSQAVSLSAPGVFDIEGAVAGASDTTIGLLTGSGSGTISRLYDRVAGGIANLDQSDTGGTYTVAGNGRARVSFATGDTYALYLYAPDDAFVLETSSAAVGYGELQPQGPGPFSPAGTFAAGTRIPVLPTAPNVLEETTLNNGAFTVVLPNGNAFGTYSMDSATGRGVASLNQAVLGANTSLVLYAVDSNRILAMGSGAVVNNAIEILQR